MPVSQHTASKYGAQTSERSVGHHGHVDGLEPGEQFRLLEVWVVLDLVADRPMPRVAEDIVHDH